MPSCCIRASQAASRLAGPPRQTGVQKNHAYRHSRHGNSQVRRERLKLTTVQTAHQDFRQERKHAFTAVRLKGMPSMPSGRREGMGPYEPSRRFRKRLCVRGVPTCKPSSYPKPSLPGIELEHTTSCPWPASHHALVLQSATIHWSHLVQLTEEPGTMLMGQ